jgi:hypothetical protein
VGNHTTSNVVNVTVLNHPVSGEAGLALRNSFNPRNNELADVPGPGEARIYDPIGGRLIQTLGDDSLTTSLNGALVHKWNGRDRNNNLVPPGDYVAIANGKKIKYCVR